MGKCDGKVHQHAMCFVVKALSGWLSRADRLAPGGGIPQCRHGAAQDCLVCAIAPFGVGFLRIRNR